VNFNDHSDLEGRHAYLSASKYAWIRYDDDKIEDTFRSSFDAMLGTTLHEFAARAIKLRQKLAETEQTLNRYVNDAIGFRMKPEVMVVFTKNAFGTADALSYRNGELRVHDLKTGKSKASFDQLLIYVAYFCLEYNLKPAEIPYIELRIYQNDEVYVLEPDIDVITHIMDRAVTADRIIEELKLEMFG
jgi:hypothetical protein